MTTILKKGSKNREKIKLKIKRAYMKLKNIRKHLIHNITNKIIKDNDRNTNAIGKTGS